jgi:hypothetical protein
MKHIPILFSTPMVQAILEGRKTQTRRLINVDPKADYLPDLNLLGNTFVEPDGKLVEPTMAAVIKPKYNVGDVLWVRETWCYVMLDHAHDLLEGRRESNQFVFKTEVHEDWMLYAKEKYGYKWKPSIHMPKEACRLFLRVKSLRVERLQDINHKDAIAEGIDSKNTVVSLTPVTAYRDYVNQDNYFQRPDYSFMTLWQSINGPESWDANPWVWVVEFERITKEEAGL